MKKLLILFAIIPVLACGQTKTNFEDLPEATTLQPTDQATLYRGGQAYRMYSTYLLSDVNDSIDWLADTSRSHTDRIAALESAGSDSSWTSITVDTINGSTEDGVDIEDVILNGGNIGLGSDGKVQFSANDYIYRSTSDTVFHIVNDVQVMRVYDGGVHISDKIHVDSSGVYATTSGSGANMEWAFTDPKNGTKKMTELLAGDGGSSDSSWTSIDIDTINGPIVVTDDIDLPEEKAVNFRSNNSIFSPGSNTLRLTAGGNAAFDCSSTTNTTYHSIIPNSNNTFTLGDNTHSFTQLYVNSINLSSSSYNVGVVGNDIALTSPDAGTVYLADLSGGTPSDTFSIDTAFHALTDSLVIAGGIGLGNSGDTISMQVGANAAEVPQIQDSAIFLSTFSYCEKTSGNVTFRWWYQAAPDSAKNYIMAATSVTTGTPVTTTTFTTVKVGPGCIIGCDLTAVGAILPDKFRTNLYYYEKRAY